MDDGADDHVWYYREVRDTIPEDVKHVQVDPSITKTNVDTFCGRRLLKKVDLPEGLKAIGRGAFRGCCLLQKVKLPPQGPKSIGEGTFRGCRSLTEVELPRGLKTIGKEAFRGCTSLKIIKLPIIRQINW